MTALTHYADPNPEGVDQPRRPQPSKLGVRTAARSGASLPWDGQHEEGWIERPGKKYPWVYVIQPDGDSFAWGIYSQGKSERAFWSGSAPTLEEARAQATSAPIRTAHIRRRAAKGRISAKQVRVGDVLTEYGGPTVVSIETEVPVRYNREGGIDNGVRFHLDPPLITGSATLSMAYDEPIIVADRGGRKPFVDPPRVVDPKATYNGYCPVCQRDVRIPGVGGKLPRHNSDKPRQGISGSLCDGSGKTLEEAKVIADEKRARWEREQRNRTYARSGDLAFASTRGLDSMFAMLTTAASECPVCGGSCPPGMKWCSDACYLAENPPEKDEDDEGTYEASKRATAQSLLMRGIILHAPYCPGPECSICGESVDDEEAERNMVGIALHHDTQAIAHQAASGTCAQCKERPATKYVMGPNAGDWGDRYCDTCADLVAKGYGGRAIVEDLARRGSVSVATGANATFLISRNADGDPTGFRVLRPGMVEVKPFEGKKRPTLFGDMIQHFAYGEQKAPPQVDTLRDEQCPVCGETEAFTGDDCGVCGFKKPPDAFLDPDLDKAKSVDLRQDTSEAQDATSTTDDTLQCDNCGKTFGGGPGAAGGPPAGTPGGTGLERFKVGAKGDWSAHDRQAALPPPDAGGDPNGEANPTTSPKAGDPCPECGEGTLHPVPPAESPTEGVSTEQPATGSNPQEAPVEDEGDDKPEAEKDSDTEGDKPAEAKPEAKDDDEDEDKPKPPKEQSRR